MFRAIDFSNENNKHIVAELKNGEVLHFDNLVNFVYNGRHCMEFYRKDEDEYKDGRLGFAAAIPYDNILYVYQTMDEVDDSERFSK